MPTTTYTQDMEFPIVVNPGGRIVQVTAEIYDAGDGVEGIVHNQQFRLATSQEIEAYYDYVKKTGRKALAKRAGVELTDEQLLSEDIGIAAPTADMAVAHPNAFVGDADEFGDEDDAVTTVDAGEEDGEVQTETVVTDDDEVEIPRRGRLAGSGEYRSKQGRR